MDINKEDVKPQGCFGRGGANRIKSIVEAGGTWK